jgi:hypothetical protein
MNRNLSARGARMGVISGSNERTRMRDSSKVHAITPYARCQTRAISLVQQRRDGSACERAWRVITRTGDIAPFPRTAKTRFSTAREEWRG